MKRHSKFLLLAFVTCTTLSGHAQDFVRWIEPRFSVFFSDVLPGNYSELSSISRELTHLLTRNIKNEHAAGFFRKNSPRQVQAIACFKAEYPQINDSALALVSLLSGFHVYYHDKFDLSGPCKFSILEAIECQLIVNALIDERRNLVECLNCLQQKIKDLQYFNLKLRQIMNQEDDDNGLYFEILPVFRQALDYFSAIKSGNSAGTQVITVSFPYPIALEQWIEIRYDLRRIELLNTSLKTGIVPANYPIYLPAILNNVKSPAPFVSAKTLEDNDLKPVKYRVKKGDTLTSIAKKFGTTVEAIKKENKLRSDRINEGQHLQIPQQ